MGFFTRQPKAPAEHIYVVPLAARKLPSPAAPSSKVYIYYAFVSAASADQALGLVKAAVHDDGFEFVELTGRITYTDRAEWDQFVAKNFNWIRDTMPTGQQLDKFVNGVVHYSPKIVRM